MPCVPIMQLRMCIISEVLFSKRVGLVMRQLRLERGLSQQDLANLMNYERSRIGRLELGQTAITVDILLTIANALQIDIHTLLPVEVKLKKESVATEYIPCPPATHEQTQNPSSLREIHCPTATSST